MLYKNLIIKASDELGLGSGNDDQIFYNLYYLKLRNRVFDLIDLESVTDNYLEKYKQLTKRRHPKNFDVHHIDGIRKNNHIKNLVLLPKKLHLQYHCKKKSIIPYKNQIIPDGLICSTEIYNNGGSEVGNYEKLKLYESFFKIQQLCCEWVYLRDCILGLNYYVHDTSDYLELLNNKRFNNG